MPSSSRRATSVSPASATLIFEMALVVASLAWIALGGDVAHWAHLARNVLPQAALDTAVLLKRRIDLLLALPAASLDRLSLQQAVRHIGAQA